MSKKTKNNENQTKEKKKSTPRKETQELILPPLEFSSLVLPFFTQGLLSLGQIENEKEEKDDKNIELAKRMIDLLDLLRQKTKGNLQPEEDAFLESSLHQLKLVYMDKAKIIKL
jgi:hypothetical protein